MGFWQRFWQGIRKGDTDLRDIQNILDRVEKLDPVWETIHSMTGGDVEWRVWFVQNTPDGELRTTVNLTSKTAYIKVALGSVGYLTELGYFTHETATPRGAKLSRAKVNKFAVQYVREWLDRRVVPRELAALAQKRQERESESQEREAKVAAMRKKYSL